MNGSENISVIIAEGNNQFLDQLVIWLSSEPTIDLMGTVGDGEGAVRQRELGARAVALLEVGGAPAPASSTTTDTSRR